MVNTIDTSLYTDIDICNSIFLIKWSAVWLEVVGV
jgi:hypothetical protein